MLSQYDMMRIISRTNNVGTKKEYQIRDIRNRITRDFKKSIDAEDVTINGEEHTILITRDKGDGRIKKIKSYPDDSFELGQIVTWNDVNYIIYKMDADRRIQSKGVMYECNTKLRWRNKHGEIVERVGKGEDATKYSEGTEGGNIMRTGEFQIKVLIPLDEETALIKRDDRFIIDADAFIDVMVESGIMPYVFKVTRKNVITGTFPEHGYVEITMVEDEFVSGHDDLENMVACPKSEMILNGSEGHKEVEDSPEQDDEGGWLD